MNPFALSGLLAGLTSFIFGLVVLIKSENKKLGRIWFLFSLSVAVWGFGGFILGQVSFEKALQYWRIVFGVGVVWIPVLFHHFITVFLDIKNRRFVAVQYCVGFLFSGLTTTPFFFERTDYLFNQLHWAQFYKPIIWIYLPWWIGSVVYSHIILSKEFVHATSIKKNQIKYFFLSTFIGFFGGSFCYLPNIGISLYPWSNFSVFPYPLIMTYAILKYHLMDMKVFIRRAALLTGVYLVLLAFTAPFIIYLHKQITVNSGGSLGLFFSGVIVVGLVVSLGPILYAYFIRQGSYFKEHTIAGIAHELKSPLSSIQGAVELLTQKGAPAEYLDIIQRNCDRLELFSRDFIQATKINSSKIELDKSHVNIDDLIQTVLSRYSDKAKLKGIQVQSKHSSHQEEISLDQEKIAQVLSNLLSNSIKYSNRGIINIEEKRVNGHIEISVSDKGEGINREKVPKIFDRFYKANSATKGTGLGLTIAKNWVEAHGGKIWAESGGEGKGTTVTFTLPIT